MTHILKGWLKVVVEEMNKEKALKQVSKSTLNDKALELASMDQKAMATKRARDSIK